jgi:hypothetical protein
MDHVRFIESPLSGILSDDFRERSIKNERLSRVYALNVRNIFVKCIDFKRYEIFYALVLDVIEERCID